MVVYLSAQGKKKQFFLMPYYVSPGDYLSMGITEAFYFTSLNDNHRQSSAILKPCEICSKIVLGSS